MKTLKPANWIRSTVSFCLFLCEVETKCGLVVVLVGCKRTPPPPRKKDFSFCSLGCFCNFNSFFFRPTANTQQALFIVCPLHTRHFISALWLICAPVLLPNAKRIDVGAPAGFFLGRRFNSLVQRAALNQLTHSARIFPSIRPSASSGRFPPRAETK